MAPGLDQQSRLIVGPTSYFVATGGDGPALLLLHGFPETHRCWQRVAPALAASYSIVAPDLKGYGASEAPAGGAHGEGYSKREMAAELVELMAALGHERFAVVGHDRGARVAHLDREHESADRAAGRRIAAPALVVTGEDEAQLADAADVWRAWADDLSATRVPGGHFLPEEAPERLGALLAAFLAA